ncbi:MAG: proprotein convertase P-domain-containing protein [Opitutales bacterium]
MTEKIPPKPSFEALGQGVRVMGSGRESLLVFFMSTFHWGEISAGEWQVHIADSEPDDTGSLVALEVEIFGTAPVLPKLELVQQSNEDLALIVDGHAGRLNVIETSEDLTHWAPLQEIRWMNGPYVVQVPWESKTRFYRVRIP